MSDYICSYCRKSPKACKCHRDKVTHTWTDDTGREMEMVEWLGPEFIREGLHIEYADGSDEWIPFP